MMNEYVFPEGGGKEVLAEEGHSNLNSKEDSLCF
jgi:hypothetical protein